jgi:predicted small secreted protein
MKKPIQAMVMALTLTLVLSACNTVKGAGKDVQSAGEAVEDAAK